VVLFFGVLLFASFLVYELGYYNFTDVRVTWAVTTHFPDGSTNVNYNVWQHYGDSGAQLHFGQEFTINEKSNWAPGGNLTLKNAVCNTAGFNLTKVTPTLPLLLVQEPSGVPKNFSVKITFTMPAAPYTGTLNYTLYFDYYP
jgi:hypothetical protein